MNAQVGVPSGVHTFLFTDIEGSTRRWESDAEAMRVGLGRHDETLRNAVSAHSGTVFKHTGDGICAVFDRPSATVAAAVAAQRILELPVRMGIATGETEHRDGDYFGPVLNRAARIMAAGHGGQILLDDVSAALVSGVDVISLGRKRLRDIARPLDLYQVWATGLRRDFAPLKTLDAKTGNLRLPPTTLIGRDHDLAELTTLIQRHRLVTLTGVGGVGKTRLALESAARSAPHFPDGVWVIELAAVSDPAAVPAAVAAVLGILQQPDMTLVESVAAALEGRTRLLVFDNCEHILDAATDLAEAILLSSTSVRILATSREGLRVADEQLWPVLPLEHHGTESTSLTLFLQRATAVVPGAPLRDHIDVIADICRHLDGIPLALELAASRLQSMTVTELWERLDDRFRLLVGSHRSSARHHTLHHAVQWSYDLLDDDERHFLTMCSVFAGGFDLRAADAITATDNEVATLLVLDALVRKSLVVADQSSSRTRYSMLETIRQFGTEQLAQAGLTNRARAEHARYFAGLEDSVLARWDGPLQREAYEWFSTELANLRAAYRFAVDSRDLDTASTIAVYTAFLGGWIEQHEPSTWAEALLESARAAEHPRLEQLYVAAAECYRTGRITQAVEYADAAVAVMDSGRFRRALFDIEPTALGGTFITDGLSERWLELCRRAIASGRGMNAFNQGSFVMALTTCGRSDEAKATCVDLLAAVEATDNPGARAYALLAYGYGRRDDDLPAYEALRRGLVFAQASGNRMIESYLAVNLSTFTGRHGTAADAFDFLELAIHNFHDTGSYSHMVSPLGVLAAHLERIGDHEGAATVIGYADTAFALATFPEVSASIARLREMLGDAAYQALVREGRAMTSAGIAQYALDQIDIARATLAADERA